jgi:hypothetical protein
MTIERCTLEDYVQILSNLTEFWGSERTRGLHHPMFVREFGDSAPGNAHSIAFHTSLGMSLIGQPNADGIPVVQDYAGPGEDRVVFDMSIEGI